ncbi:MAG: phasin, PhaP [Alphaproteobacteria bacterium]|nr:MAG: phasin, PhaP [Alphaproteobacteria bacterium]
MAKAQDYTKYFADMMGAFPVDQKAFENAFRSQAALAEKLMNVALEAAEKSTEVSSAWTKETLAKVADVVKVKEDPADYTKAVTDFASAAAETNVEKIAAFAEIAKKVQMETVELMLAAGKDLSEDATAAVKKATAEATTAVKKAAAAAK